MVSGPPADPFLVGLAVLTLLSDAAEARPVLCVVDDAQWLDDESADILGFVARRLLADRIGSLFAIRETTEPVPRLQALPGLRIAGLPEQDASALLETSINRPSVTSSKSCSRGARGICPRTRRRCCCWRRQTNRGKQIACGRRPPHWASAGRRGARGGRGNAGFVAGGADLPSAGPVGDLPRRASGPAAARPDGTRTSPCSCRSRRRPHRCWSTTFRRAAMRSPANGW